MKWVLAFQCLCLLSAYVNAAPPVLPGIGDTSVPLAANCQIPKCPEVKNQKDIKTPVVLPYPLDCFQYVICNGSEARIVACPPDTIFDKSKASCVPQQTFKCVPCYQEAA